jgi:His-Xaa-Ser system protein HxsD
VIDNFILQVEDGQILLAVSSKLYDKTTLFRTCYVFTDRCYLYLSPGGEDDVHVYLKAKGNGLELEQVAGEFCNELIDQQVRQDLDRQTGEIRKLIVAQAFAEGDLLDQVREQSDYKEDPLGIGKR